MESEFKIDFEKLNLSPATLLVTYYDKDQDGAPLGSRAVTWLENARRTIARAVSDWVPEKQVLMLPTHLRIEAHSREQAEILLRQVEALKARLEDYLAKTKKETSST